MHLVFKETEIKELDAIAEKKQIFWKKMDRIRTYLMKEKGLSSKDATHYANRYVKDLESGHIDHDNEYMQKHFESIANLQKDPDEIFWESMGISDEETRNKLEEHHG